MAPLLALLAVLSESAAAAASRAIYFEGGPSIRDGRWALADDGFAARELARYVSLTTGAYPVVVDAAESPAALAEAAARGAHEAIVIAAPGSALLAAATSLVAVEPRSEVLGAAASMDASAEAGQHAIRKLTAASGATVTLIVGAGEFGRLYGAYTAAEQLGVRFELTGDILPDPTQQGGLPLAGVAELPLAHTDASPAFDYRGLQPFHDFPEGPDWWDTEHYKLILTQLSKMKMNFLGLHTYPYSATDAGHSTGHNEPTVFVGTADDLEADGSVKVASAYPTSYANTMRVR